MENKITSLVNESSSAQEEILPVDSGDTTTDKELPQKTPLISSTFTGKGNPTFAHHQKR